MDLQWVKIAWLAGAGAKLKEKMGDPISRDRRLGGSGATHTTMACADETAKARRISLAVEAMVGGDTPLPCAGRPEGLDVE